MLKNCHEKWDILKLLAFWKLHFWVFALKINLRRTKNSLSIKMRNVCLGLGVWRYGNIFFPWIKKELSVLPCLSSGLRFLTQDWRVCYESEDSRHWFFAWEYRVCVAVADHATSSMSVLDSWSIFLIYRLSYKYTEMSFPTVYDMFWHLR